VFMFTFCSNFAFVFGDSCFRGLVDVLGLVGATVGFLYASWSKGEEVRKWRHWQVHLGECFAYFYS
jgi:hypothetical protein